MKKIMLVDDEPGILAPICKILVIKGYEVVTATDGEDALRRLQDFEPDLIIADVMMPKKDGIELSKDIKKNEKLRNVPIILMSAGIIKEQSDKNWERYIKKPFNVSSLVKEVEDLL